MKFGKLIADNYPDINIIYTRTTDVDVALSERAHIANRSKADLFISIHANSHPTHQPTGVETFVMGLSQSKSNMEVAKKENADILLEAGYADNVEYKGFDPNSPESYVQFAMFQNAFMDRSLNFAGFIQKQYAGRISTVNRGVKQAELFVLYKTTCPAVLTEIGFISNPAEEQYMMSDMGQGTLAECLLRAFAQYKAQLEGTKAPAKFEIDLPGYGKNAPSTAELAARAKAEADSMAAIQQAMLAQQMADSIARVEADSIAAMQPVGTTHDKPAPPQAPESTKPIDEPYVPKEEVKTTEGIVYRVQFLVSPKQLMPGDKKFKGLEDYEMYIQDGTYRYTMGNCATTKEAAKIQYEVRKKGFDDAFVIAFYNGTRISIQQAKEMLEEQ